MKTIRKKQKSYYFSPPLIITSKRTTKCIFHTGFDYHSYVPKNFSYSCCKKMFSSSSHTKFTTFNTNRRNVKIHVIFFFFLRYKKVCTEWCLGSSVHSQPADQLTLPSHMHFVESHLMVQMSWLHYINEKQIQTDQLQLRSFVTKQKKYRKNWSLRH